MSELAFGTLGLAAIPREPELPWWMRKQQKIRRLPLYDHWLPAEASFRGWYLENVAGSDAYGPKEVTILYDKEGSILHEWAPGIMPSLGEIEEIVQQLIKGEKKHESN